MLYHTTERRGLQPNSRKNLGESPLSRGADQKVNDESIRDTLIDLANYAIMTVLEMEVENDDRE